MAEFFKLQLNQCPECPQALQVTLSEFMKSAIPFVAYLLLHACTVTSENNV